MSGPVPAAQPDLVGHFTSALPGMLEDIRRLVECESPSSDLDAVARSADRVAEVARPLIGVDPDVIVLDGRTHVRWRLGEQPAKVLLLGHHDTVWPVGSLGHHPFAVHGDQLVGPGCFDMKAGLVLALHALAALAEVSAVTLLVTGDEELGSPSSRALIEAEARGCEAVLVMEPSGAGGALKRQRKGVSRYEVHVHGRGAHAGLEPEVGVNAAVEMAHQILAVGAIADDELGTTVTATVATAGDSANTVPARARFAIDCRVWTTAEQDRVHHAMLALAPCLDGSRLEVTGGPNRPPMEADLSAALFEAARGHAKALGLEELSGVAVGGASDGNFTAGLGVATLDGLGAVGGGAHSDDEHVRIPELPARAALLSALIADFSGSRLSVGSRR